MVNENDSQQVADDLLEDFLQPVADDNETPPEELLDVAEDVLALDDPETETEEEDSNLEVSEEEQPSDDEDSTVEDGDDEEETEEVASEDAVETLEEFEGEYIAYEDIDKPLEFDGKLYSRSQLKSALGRQSANSKAQNEIETARNELEAERSLIEEERQGLETQRQSVQLSQEIGVKAAKVQSAEAAVAQARESGDPTELVLAKDKLDVAKAEYHVEVQKAQEIQAEAMQHHIANEQRILDKLGYGDLLTDPQRSDSLQDYINSVLPEAVAQAVLHKAELTVAMEKARLWDKSQKDKPKTKAKLKATKKKTLRAGDGKPAQSKPPKTATFAELADDIAGEMLGL